MKQQEYVYIDPNKLYLAAQEKEIPVSRLAIMCGRSKNFFTRASSEGERVNRKAAEKAEKILGVSLITDKKIARKNTKKSLRDRINEQREKIIDCMLENITPTEAAKITGIDAKKIRDIYFDEAVADAEERERRRHIRPAIIRTNSGLMYTR